MSLLRITGGNPLNGCVRVHGAKNAVLPILAATLLADGETVIRNCPRLRDVDAAIAILRHLGCRAELDEDTVYVDASGMCRCDIPDDLMREMRSSVIFLGAILARAGEAILSMPGGCELGPRPIDLHLAALRAMGAEIREQGGRIYCRSPGLRGCRIDLSFPSVGATENAMLAAACAEGVTLITNAAREPEIADLQRFLQKLGARIVGAGTSLITVEGCRAGTYSEYTEHCVIGDRIVAATLLCAAAAASGTVELRGADPAHMSTVLDALREMGCRIETGRNYVSLSAGEKRRAIRPVVTRPYPGFPTDAQPPLMAALLTASGTTAFVENIFTNRYRHVEELRRMGADVALEGRVAIVSGVERLHGAPVSATDLRGGAALAVAALGAEGTTEITGLQHIDRGYDDLAGMLAALGADVERL